MGIDTDDRGIIMAFAALAVLDKLIERLDERELLTLDDKVAIFEGAIGKLEGIDGKHALLAADFIAKMFPAVPRPSN